MVSSIFRNNFKNLKMYHLYNLAYDAQVWFSEEGKMKPQRKTVHDRSSMITYYMDVLEIMTVAGSAE